MERIKIQNVEYGIKSIRYLSESVLQIEFNDTVPQSFEEKIELYTSGGILCETFVGFNTIYRSEENIIELSNDGTVYVPVEEVQFEYMEFDYTGEETGSEEAIVETEISSDFLASNTTESDTPEPSNIPVEPTENITE